MKRDWFLWTLVGLGLSYLTIDFWDGVPVWVFIVIGVVASVAWMVQVAVPALRDPDRVWPWSGDGDISRDVW